MLKHEQVGENKVISSTTIPLYICQLDEAVWSIPCTFCISFIGQSIVIIGEN